MDYMYHFTRDGEYVDGVPITLKQIGDSALLGQLAATYEGCHVWVFLSSAKGEWMQIVAAALPYERWRGELTHMVPECVRTAEYVRDR